MHQEESSGLISQRHARIITKHELSGHNDVKTTMIYTHVLNRRKQACAVRLTVPSVRLGRKTIMPIRIKHRDKLGARVQPSKDQELSAQLATGSIACYAGRNAKVRIVCG